MTISYAALRRRIRKGTRIRSESPLNPPMLRTVTRTTVRGYYFTWQALGSTRNAFAEYAPARDVTVHDADRWTASMRYADIDYEIQPS